MQHQQVDAVIAEQARDWVVRLFAENASAAERAQLVQWRAADERHEIAYRRAEALWRNLGKWKDLADLAPVQRGDSSSHGKRHWFVAAAAAAVIAIVSTGFLRQRTLLFSPRLDTQIAEVRSVALPDGSTVTLGAKSGLKVAFSSAERRVRLLNGDAFFAVTKDPLKPFVVEAGDTEVRVIGTQFDVHRGPEQVRVAVLEGAVHVTAADREDDMRPLIAGQEIVSASGRLEHVRDVSFAKPGSWREGRLTYVDASLAEIVADANRYSDKTVRFASPKLANLRLTAAFRTNQIDEMINTLERTLPIRAERNSGSVMLYPTMRE